MKRASKSHSGTLKCIQALNLKPQAIIQRYLGMWLMIAYPHILHPFFKHTLFAYTSGDNLLQVAISLLTFFTALLRCEDRAIKIAPSCSAAK